MHRYGCSLDDVAVLPANRGVQPNEQIFVGEFDYISAAERNTEVIRYLLRKLWGGSACKQPNIAIEEVVPHVRRSHTNRLSLLMIFGPIPGGGCSSGKRHGSVRKNNVLL